MSTQRKKRFIAGATCPHCKAVDSIMLYMENDVEKIECVECHHQQSQVSDDVAKAAQTPGDVIGIFKPE
ncbi:MAG: YheV family putative metal-binding protein [Gammaproteobacteria bacterium]|nr:YheV family putative metal-binding protein [Gammaproteobacteria bacterium]